MLLQLDEIINASAKNTLILFGPPVELVPLFEEIQHIGAFESLLPFDRFPSMLVLMPPVSVSPGSDAGLNIQILTPYSAYRENFKKLSLTFP